MGLYLDTVRRCPSARRPPFYYREVKRRWALIRVRATPNELVCAIACPTMWLLFVPRNERFTIPFDERMPERGVIRVHRYKIINKTVDFAQLQIASICKNSLSFFKYCATESRCIIIWLKKVVKIKERKQLKNSYGNRVHKPVFTQVCRQNIHLWNGTRWPGSVSLERKGMQRRFDCYAWRN